jgi:ADP-ribose pyrophosphatase YjhB (NUDIX family)
MPALNPQVKHCSYCGAPVSARVPSGDSLPRHVCDACDTIHYENPKLVVGCIAEWQDRILLCRRAIDPRRGLWTLPAGFMENHETTAQAAERETLEEACARIRTGPLFALVDIPHISQVHLFYRGEMIDGHHEAGEESLQTALLAESEIPWDEIAFRSVTFALRAYFEDRRREQWQMHSTALSPPPA